MKMAGGEVTITNLAITATTDPQPIEPIEGLYQIGLMIQNLDAASVIYAGGAGVTVLTGIRIKADGGILELSHQWADGVWYIIGAAGGEDVRILQVSVSDIWNIRY